MTEHPPVDSDSDDSPIVRGRRVAASKIESTPEEKDVISAPIETIKKPKKAVVKPKSKAIEDVDNYAFELINMMKEVYKQDTKANKEGRPSMLKINSVDEVYHKIMRKETQEACIKLGALHELRTWLEPLPDNSLPNQKIKKVLLELLYNIRATRSDLANSGIGKIVHFYSKNRHEAKEVRKTALHIISKWKRMIIREEMEE